MELSDGQRLALTQLAEIAAHSLGSLQILSNPEPIEGSTSVRIELSLATRAYRRPRGLAFRDRERLRLVLDADFPFQHPSLDFRDKRYLGAPHVNWGTHICLFQSIETEWQASDGMFGFIERVGQWFTAAGAGTLVTEDAPLHPPVAIASAKVKFVIKADTPTLAGIESFWLGRAELAGQRADRFDAIGWTAIDDWDAPLTGSHSAAAVLLTQPMPHEYPLRFIDLYAALERAGVPLRLLIRILRLEALMTPVGEPSYFVIGAPMRRKEAGAPLRPHLTVWQLDAEALATLRAFTFEAPEGAAEREAALEWMVTAKVAWCTVFEDRAEIVFRRDHDRLGAYLLAKRVLLLGCGALGSAIAEQIVRAGAHAIELVDNGTVKPGLLVRQRFTDADIGKFKVLALRDRLNGLGLPCAVTIKGNNLKAAALSPCELSQFDCIIDATASAGVSRRIEQELAASKLAIPLVGVSVSAGAEHGAVLIKMPGYAGGPVQIARQAKLEALALDPRHASVAAFWPKAETIRFFQPEPGCSDPTFTGSAAELDHFAGGLLTCALQRIATLGAKQASMDLIPAPWLGAGAVRSAPLRLAFDGYRRLQERRHRYRVLLSQSAEAGIRAEIARIARVRASTVETGGLMFGEIDDAHRHIWIDSVSGPPADSEASEEKFLCGTAGTVELARFKDAASAGSSRFVGIWHTHPVSRGSPSADDLHAMAQLLFLQPNPPRQVVMLIIGFAASRPQHNFYLYHRSDFHFDVLVAAAEADHG